MAKTPGKRPGKRPPPSPTKAPAKVVRPPGKKASPLLAPSDLPSRLEVLRDEFDPTATPQQRRGWSARLRLIAGMLVAHDDLMRTVVQWHTDHFSDLISLSAFQRWSIEDRWLQKRGDRQQRIREEIERQIGTENVRSFIADLKKLDVLHDDISGALTGERNVVVQEYTDEKGVVHKREIQVVPVGFEKRSEAVRALVDLDRRRDEKRKGVLGGLPAALGTGSVEPGGGNVVNVTVQISPNVARAMARAKLIAERGEIEGGAPPEDNDDDE